MQRHEKKMHNLKSYSSWLKKKSTALTRGNSIEEYNTQKGNNINKEIDFCSVPTLSNQASFSVS